MPAKLLPVQRALRPGRLSVPEDATSGPAKPLPAQRVLKRNGQTEHDGVRPGKRPGSQPPLVLAGEVLERATPSPPQ